MKPSSLQKPLQHQKLELPIEKDMELLSMEQSQQFLHGQFGSLFGL
uniref:Uncharacterized protein n=1 Tax=Rhizophora mucronata TaxID=61149 RepID=A0A2P2IQG0_RHIMU